MCSTPHAGLLRLQRSEVSGNLHPGIVDPNVTTLAAPSSFCDLALTSRNPAAVRGWLQADDGTMKFKAANDSTESTPSSEPLMMQEQPLPWKNSYKRLERRHLLLGSAAMAIVGISYYIFSTAGTATILTGTGYVSQEPYFSPLYRNGLATVGTFPIQVSTDKSGLATYPPHIASELSYDYCSICDCHATPTFYAPSDKLSPQFPPRPRVNDVRPSSYTVEVNEYVREMILDIYCDRQQLTPEKAVSLVQRATRNLGELASWNLGALDFGRPTVYLTTATSPNSKAKKLRPQYITRHGTTITSWLSKQAADAQRSGWQVVWIVAEDEGVIDPLVERALRRSGVPYVYFAYGLTAAHGNAQKSALLQLVHALSRPGHGLYGNGPVYGLDDDNKIVADLLELITRVVRIGVFPVGNLGPDGWEKPILNEDGEVVDSNSPWRRKFSFDYGGYAFNSSLLGTVISATKFWDFYSRGGESEFIDRIVSNMRDIEPLCGNDQAHCHYVWHNADLTDAEKEAD